MMITSGPWLKIAPNCGGQWRRQASQLMHSSISIRNGAFCHFSLRVRVAMRSSRVAAIGIECRSTAGRRLDPWVKVAARLVVVTDQVETSSQADRQHTEHGRERKQQLLDAATELFAERGYGATRIVDICQRAGVTKRELFVDLVRTMRLRLRRAQAAAMDHGSDALTRIGQGAAASVRFMADHAAYFALVDHERADPDLADVLREGSDVYLDDVRILVEEGQRNGCVIDADATVLAIGVLGAVSSFSNAFRSGRLPASTTVEDLERVVVRWVTHALT
jgi:AcrR family transcriptional regulator